MPSLSELQAQLQDVNQRMHAAWLHEREQARRRICELAVEFQLPVETLAKDVEAALRRAPAPPDVLKPPRIDVPLRRTDAKQHVAPKYRNPDDGKEWSGRGPMPRWLRTQVDAGRRIEDFLIVEQSAQEITDPLRLFQDAAARSKAGL